MSGFTCMGSDIVNALDRIVKVTAKEPAKLTLSGGNHTNKIEFTAEHDSKLIQYYIPAINVEKFEPISVPVDRLKSACSKKVAMIFKVSENSLSFKTKDDVSKGEIFLKEQETIDFSRTLFPKDFLMVTKDVIDLFSYVELSPDISQSDLICFLDSTTTSKLRLASANNNVVAYLSYKSKVEFNPIKTSILIKYINVFNNLFNKEPYKLHIGESVIYAKCGTVYIKLPAFELGDLNLDLISKTVEERVPTITFSCALTALTTALSNIKSAYDKGKPIELVIKDNSLIVKMLSNFGKAYETVEITNLVIGKTKNRSINMNYDMLNNLLSTASKVKGELSIGFVEDTALKITVTHSNFDIVYMLASVTS